MIMIYDHFHLLICYYPYDVKWFGLEENHVTNFS
jgi:hypothetical protein